MPFRLNEEQLERDLQQSPSIRLLKADNAALIIGFLHQQFKYTQRTSIPLTEVTEQLEGYLGFLNERAPGRYPRSAQAYLNEWTDDQHCFVRIIPYGSSDGAMVELTAAAERAIGWLEDMQQVRHFVGTESRFFLIIQLIRDIIENSTTDPYKRLEQLERQRAELDRQIEKIYETETVDHLLTPLQLRERFMDASNLARQLLRDFRLVEEKFRDIARHLQQEQLRPGVRKGELVEFVLDADADLKASDQGRSFYTFWEFLRSPSQSDELKYLLEQLTALAALRTALDEDNLLLRLPGYLVEAGEKVVQSNGRLAEQLRRLLDEHARAENQRVQELIREIKHEAYHLSRSLPGNTILAELEGPPDVELSMERGLWEPSRSQTFSEEPEQVREENLRDVDLSGLYTQFSVDETQLQRQIETLLEHKPRVSLSEVLACYPVRQGLAEILTYCVLAARDERHSINAEASEEITYEGESGQRKVLIVPQIFYRRSPHAQ
ncbi:MAG: DUF3375 domain-containing protein [Ktedonobacteraceae bacterium]|nr:DUF3375 domain-containing protein [Ktedonobacteraceae bacterium]